jgi:hypothetical protein
MVSLFSQSISSLTNQEDADRCLVRRSFNVSGLEQTVDSYRYKVVWFLLDAPSSQAGARNALWVRRKNRKQNQIPSEISDRRKARTFGGFP